MRRVEHEPYEGWIARDRRGAEIGGEGFRWSSRSVARAVVLETDMIEDQRAGVIPTPADPASYKVQRIRDAQ